MNANEQDWVRTMVIQQTLRRLKQAEINLLRIVQTNNHSTHGLLLEAHSFIWEAISALEKAGLATAGIAPLDSGRAVSASAPERESAPTPAAPLGNSSQSAHGLRGVEVGETVTRRDAERAAMVAGFKRMPSSEPSRGVFARGRSTLVVHSDGKWTCSAQIVGRKQPAFSGEDLSSLRGFLLSESQAIHS